MSLLDYVTNLKGWFPMDQMPIPLGSSCVGLRGGTILNQAGIDISGISSDVSAGGGGSGFPFFGLEFLNGRPVCSLSSAAGGFGGWSSTAVINTYLTVGPKTVVAVVRIDSIPTDNASFDNAAVFSELTAANTGVCLQVRNQTPPVLESRHFDGTQDAVTVPITLGQWGLAILQHDGATLYVGWNDEQNMNSVASGASTTMVFPLGIGVSTGIAGVQRSFTGAIAEIMFYREFTSAVNLAKICNYLRAKWFSPNSVIASPSMRADALEQARDVASRRLWWQRQAVPIVTAEVPLWVALDADVLTDIAVATPLGPSPSADGTGWKNARPDRRRLRLYSSTIDMDKLGAATITASDMRDVSHIYQETGLAIRASSLQRQGVANDGGVRVFARGHTAWIVDPSSGAVVQIAAAAEKVAAGGLLLEDGGRNYNLRSAFISSSSGLTSSGGSGVIAVIATDAAPPGGLLFDGAVTANSLSISLTATGTSGANSRLVVIHPNFSVPFDQNVLMFNIDHYDDIIPASSLGLGFGLTRTSDGFAWDVATNAWSSTKGTVLNQIPVSTGAFARYSVAIANPTTSGGAVFTAGSSYNLAYGFSPTVTSTHLAHVFQAELVGSVVPSSSFGSDPGIQPYFATSRIVTDTVVVDRTPDRLVYFSAGYGILGPSVGTLRFKFCPLWNAADVRYKNTIGATTVGATALPMILGYDVTMPIFQCGVAATSAMMWAGAQFDAATSALQFIIAASTSSFVTATVPWSPVAGTTYKLTFRWTSPTEGELGLPANTVSVFVNGVKGTDVVASSSALAAISFPFYWSNSQGMVNTDVGQGFVRTPNANITSIESLAEARTDQEVAAW